MVGWTYGGEFFRLKVTEGAKPTVAAGRSQRVLGIGSKE